MEETQSDIILKINFDEKYTQKHKIILNIYFMINKRTTTQYTLSLHIGTHNAR